MSVSLLPIRTDAPRRAAQTSWLSEAETGRAPLPEHAMALAQALQACCPDMVILQGNEALAPFETDALIAVRVTPMLAVLPTCAAEVQAVVQLCRTWQVPVVTRGAGTGISGGAIPRRDGVLLVMTKMRALVSLDPLARQATVQPGHRNLAVSEAAAPHGLFYAPDPSSQLIASIGGNIAENAGGIHCLKYGFTTHNVQAVHAIDGDGGPLSIGLLALDAPGYDLLALIVGSEGNLAVVTQATLRLLPLPQMTVTLMASFASIAAAAEAVGTILGAGVIPAALEMMDRTVIEACEKLLQAGFPLGVEAALLVELDGQTEEVLSAREQVEQLLLAAGCSDLRMAETEAARAKLWRSRKGAFAALATIHPDYYTIDGTIPRRSLPHVLAKSAEWAAAAGLLVANVFHAGDGNIHPCIFYNAEVPGDLAKSEALAGAILELCVAVGGTITGEHGVGVEKLKQMCVQFRPGEIAAFHAVKAAFDPLSLLNPGKAVPTLKRCGEWGGLGSTGGQGVASAHASLPRF